MVSLIYIMKVFVVDENNKQPDFPNAVPGFRRWMSLSPTFYEQKKKLDDKSASRFLSKNNRARFSEEGEKNPLPNFHEMEEFLFNFSRGYCVLLTVVRISVLVRETSRARIKVFSRNKRKREEKTFLSNRGGVEKVRWVLS